MDDQIAPLAAGWLKDLFNGRVELTGTPGHDDWRITLWSGAQPIEGMRVIITAIEVQMIGQKAPQGHPDESDRE